MGKKREVSRQAPTRKTKAAVDRLQNNGMFRQCPSGITQQLPNHAIAVPTAMLNRVTKTMSNSQAQLHLLALDLLWANLRVQLMMMS